MSRADRWPNLPKPLKTPAKYYSRSLPIISANSLHLNYMEIHRQFPGAIMATRRPKTWSIWAEKTCDVGTAKGRKNEIKKLDISPNFRHLTRLESTNRPPDHRQNASNFVESMSNKPFGINTQRADSQAIRIDSLTI
jgi:hypothetical protein